MKNKRVLLLVLFFVALGLSSFPFIGNAQADIPYTFDTDVLYSEVDPNFFVDKLSNAKNSSTFTGLYNATETFTDDIDGGKPIGWTIIDSGDVSAEVISEFIDHEKVLQLNDTDNAGLIITRVGMVQGLDTTIEFWLAKGDVSPDTQLDVKLREGVTEIVTLIWEGDDFSYFPSGGPTTTIKSDFMLADTFFHFEVILDDTANTFDVYVNTILEGNNLNYRANSINGVDIFDFRSSFSDNGYLGYIDGLGWDTDSFYDVGDNFIPIIDMNESIKEVDRWEFAYSSFQVLYATGTSVFSDWTEINDPHDAVVIATNPDWNSDRRIFVEHNAPEAHDLGIEREFTITSTIVNVSWAWEITKLPIFGEYEFVVYSSDDTLVARVFQTNNFLKAQDSAGVIELDNGMLINKYMQFNLYINYNDEISVLNVWQDGIFFDIYYITLIASGKSGIGKIEMIVDINAAVDLACYYDYVGVYSNNTSVSTEFGHLRINDILPSEVFWEFNEFNLVNFDMIGNSSIWISRSPYLLGISNIIEIAPNEVYSEPDTTNVYGLTAFGAIDEISIKDPVIWFQFYNQFEFKEIEIGGVRLIEGLDEHILEFTFGSVDPNESYFYVDTSNRLQFRHIANDGNLEFIQARFHINNKSSDDSAIYFRSVITDRALGIFRVNYTTVSNLFPLLTSEGNSRIILSQGLTIRDYIILITDNNDDDISGLTTGFVSEVELIFITNIAVSIITSSLLDIIIPLIMIIIPTLALSARVGKNGIVPIFILMSLLLVVTEILPVWLFFVIAVSSALFIFTKRQEVLF